MLMTIVVIIVMMLISFIVTIVITVMVVIMVIRMVVMMMMDVVGIRLQKKTSFSLLHQISEKQRKRKLNSLKSATFTSIFRGWCSHQARSWPVVWDSMICSHLRSPGWSPEGKNMFTFTLITLDTEWNCDKVTVWAPSGVSSSSPGRTESRIQTKAVLNYLAKVNNAVTEFSSLQTLTVVMVTAYHLWRSTT